MALKTTSVPNKVWIQFEGKQPFKVTISEDTDIDDLKVIGIRDSKLQDKITPSDIEVKRADTILCPDNKVTSEMVDDWGKSSKMSFLFHIIPADEPPPKVKFDQDVTHTWSVFVRHLLDSKCNVGDVLNSNSEISSDLGFSFLESSIYIRYAYEALWNSITKHTAKNYNRMYRVLITGASGIGKSTFICYALAKVLKMQESTLVILSTENNYVVIDMNKGEVASVKRITLDTHLTVYINSLPKDRRFWWFMDEKQHGDYINWVPRDCVVVLTSSPHVKNYNTFKKKSKKYYMPWPCCWNGKCLGNFDSSQEEEYDDATERVIAMELYDMYKKCYQTLEWSDCKSRFDVVGPLCRYVFDTQNLTVTQLQAMVEREISKGAFEIYKALCSRDSATLAMLVQTKETSSLFLIFTPSANLDDDSNYTIMPSSAFTSQVLYEVFKTSCDEPIVRILNSEPQGMMATLWGSIYERYCIDSLGSYTKCFNLVSLSNENETKTVEIDNMRKLKVNDISIKSTLERMNKAETTLLHVNINYAAVDCIMIVKGVAYFLQITRNTCHPINAEKFKFLYEIFTDTGFKDIHFVFILPNTNKQFEKFCAQGLSKTGGAVYKSVPKNYKILIEIPQWKAEIEIPPPYSTPPLEALSLHSTSKN